MQPVICAICDREIAPEDVIEFDDQTLCPHCASVNTIICTCCGERIWNDSNSGDSDTPLCERCFDRYYTSCERCGRVISLDEACYCDDDDDYPYCHSCRDEIVSREIIHNYYYKPTPIFYGEDSRYFGVELEIDGAGESSNNAEQILDAVHRNCLELIYCKHDGSLDDGFEIVTHPMTLDFHLHEMPWESVCREAVSLGYYSHQAKTCGLHIHVNRTAFGETEYEQDSCIARILYFFEKHWEELLKFSRRTERQLERWAARYGYKENPTDILEHAKKGYSAGRYTCVNLCNTDTVEFRIFRGTLKVNTIIATLQMVNRICDLAIFSSDDEVKKLAWSDFVSDVSEPELIQYLKERRLYVNEQIESEVEV